MSTPRKNPPPVLPIPRRRQTARWRQRCAFAADRDSLLLDERPPFEQLPDILKRLGFDVAREPLQSASIGELRLRSRRVVICSDIAYKLAYPKTASRVLNSTLAHELAHIRLHGNKQPSEITAEDEADADRYAAAFLVPWPALCELPRFRVLYGRWQAGEAVSSRDLWREADRIGQQLGVTAALLAGQLSLFRLVDFIPPLRQLWFTAAS